MNEKVCGRCRRSMPTSKFYESTAQKSGFTNYCRVCLREQALERSKDFRIRAIALHGGKCSACGYSKAVEALEFHHRDPSQKDPNISRTRIGKGNWARFLMELSKCVLLCSNCHREAHVLLREASFKKESEELASYPTYQKKEPKTKPPCAKCGAECRHPRNKFCSVRCMKIARGTFGRMPSRDTLDSLLQKSKAKDVAKLFGVRHQSVYRWMKTLSIKPRSSNR